MTEAQDLPGRAAAAPATGRRRGRWPHLALEVRQHMPGPQQALMLGASLVAGIAISTLVLVTAGVPAGNLLDEFVISIFTRPRNLANVLVYTAPLVIVGLAAAVAFRARFWNIGIEGQMIFGAIGATLIANHDIGPEGARLYLMAATAAFAGMVWMLVPALLKLRLEVNEIISTLLLNYVAFNFLLFLLYGPWKDPQSAFPHSKMYDAAERLTRIGFFNVDTSIYLAFALAVGCFLLLVVSRFGFLLNFVHANPKMARAMGVRVAVLVLSAALVSAALAGVAGFVISAGIDNRMTQSFFVGYGFSGILIGFLARNNPVLVVFFAALIAVLMVAGQGLQVFYQIPSSMVLLIQAIIVICAAASEFLIRYRLRLVR